MDINSRIAANLRQRREALGLSLGQLAARSGVSKAMVAKVESGASSPTASLLGRLCGGLGVTISSLMLEAEPAGTSLQIAAEQPTWQDPETGLERTLVAPASNQSSVEVARVRLPAGKSVSYPVVPVRIVRQHIVMLSGQLTYTIGGEATDLGPGDCLFVLVDRPTRLEAGPDAAAEYFVIQEQR